MHGSDEFVQALSTEEWEKEQKMFLKHVPSVNSRRRYVIINAYTMDRRGVWSVSDLRRCSRMRVHAKLIFTFQWSNGRSSCTVWTYTSLPRGVMIVDITLSPASPVLAVQRSRCCEMFFHFDSFFCNAHHFPHPFKSKSRAPTLDADAYNLAKKNVCAAATPSPPRSSPCTMFQALIIVIRLCTDRSTDSSKGQVRGLPSVHPTAGRPQGAAGEPALSSTSPSIGALFPTQSLACIHELRDHS